ncbi:MAG: Fic family protein [Planctomycetota bacterium]|nr:Fic family protein [Planctomycetota bacterium]
MPSCRARSEFERYIHAPDQTLPLLVRAGLLHVQFESIHPYLDGNGRIGRLLVTLLLGHWNLLSAPLLYLSLFFKRHRDLYYERLDAVRHQGDWESWTDFFLEGVATVAGEATATARDLFALVTEDRSRVLAMDETSLGALRLFEDLPRHPIVESSQVVERIQTSKPTANRAIQALEAAGVLVEITGKRRDRRWAYQRYLDRLRTGTEL